MENNTMKTTTQTTTTGMKTLVKALVETRMDLIVKRSLGNCHCKGVNSIVLCEEEEGMVRLFVTDKNHDLHTPSNDFSKMEAPVAFHPHHCAITLMQVYGDMVNWTIGHDCDGVEMMKFRYKSGLNKDNDASFDPLNVEKMKTIEMLPLLEGDSCHMCPFDINTVFVPRRNTSAWFVFEGYEDKDYVPDCYSVYDIASTDYSELYTPMTEGKIRKLLRGVGLL